MTAPATPTIRAHADGSGTRVIVRWRPVLDATDYNLYLDDGTTDGIEDSFTDEEVNSDGWFHVMTSPQVGPVEVYVTSLNLGAEESDPSSRVQVNLT